jgi:hypothetical protein
MAIVDATSVLENASWPHVSRAWHYPPTTFDTFSFLLVVEGWSSCLLD